MQRVEGLVECDPCRVSLLGRRLQPLLPGLPALAPPPRPREGGPRAGRQCERWCGADQARLHHLTAVFDPLPPSHPLPGMGRSTPTAVRGPRTPSPTDDGQGRRLDEPPRPGVRRARGQEVDDAVSLQVHEERAVALPPPPGPLGHTEPLRGGGGGCRGCLPSRRRVSGLVHHWQRAASRAPAWPPRALRGWASRSVRRASGPPRGAGVPSKSGADTRDGYRKTAAPAAGGVPGRRPTADRPGSEPSGCGSAGSARGRAGRGYGRGVRSRAA